MVYVCKKYYIEGPKQVLYFVVFMLVLVIITLLVAAVEMPKYLNDRLWNNVIPAIKYISGILGKDPILDLELADQNEYCPTGYEKISLYDWGNVAFCSCITYVEMPKQKTGCGGTSCQKILAQTFWLSI